MITAKVYIGTVSFEQCMTVQNFCNTKTVIVIDTVDVCQITVTIGHNSVESLSLFQCKPAPISTFSVSGTVLAQP